MNTKGFVEKQWNLMQNADEHKRFKRKTKEFNVFIGISMMSSKQQIKTRGFEEKQQSSMCLLKYL